MRPLWHEVHSLRESKEMDRITHGQVSRSRAGRAGRGGAGETGWGELPSFV